MDGEFVLGNLDDGFAQQGLGTELGSAGESLIDKDLTILLGNLLVVNPRALHDSEKLGMVAVTPLHQDKILVSLGAIRPVGPNHSRSFHTIVDHGANKEIVLDGGGDDGITNVEVGKQGINPYVL